MKTLSQIALLCFSVVTALAQGTSEEAIVNFSSSVSGYIEGTGGWTFRPKVPLTIGQLGAMTNIVVSQGPVNVGLWSDAGTLLRSVVVNSSGDLRNRTFYSSIDPLLLVPSQIYHLGVFSPSGTVYMGIFDPQSGGSVELSSLIELGGLAEGAGGFTFPAAVTDGGGAMWLGPNAVFIPEPCSTALLGFAAVLWGLRKRFIAR